jgi:POT family proton-dependent oligopeptide transporter
MNDAAGSSRPDEWLGHPKGLFYLFFAEMWERFCYYGMRAILILYMTKHFLYPDEKASGIYGSYTSMVYLVAIAGGFLADKYLGYKRSIVMGGLMMAAGMFALLIEKEIFFFLGMALIIVGNGYFKPNISTIVGKLYSQGDPRRDAGFTIFYIGINVGAFLGTLACGWIGETRGWTEGFLIAGVGMLLGVVTFGTAGTSLQGHGEPPSPTVFKKSFPFILIGSLLTVPAFFWLLQHGEIFMYLLAGTWVIVLYVLISVALKEDQVQREKMWALIALFVFNIFFWMFFEQAGSSLTLFADRNTDRDFFGWDMPASVVQNFNSLFIVMFGPVFTALWLGLKKNEPSIPTKFALGLLQLGLGFYVLVFGANIFAEGGMTPVLWLALLYLFITTGELCLSPVGLSMVTKLAPPRLTGMVMGAWFLSIATANKFAGEIAKLTGAAGGGEGEAPKSAVETLPIYLDVFKTSAMIAAGAGVVLLLMVPLLKKWMHGVK